MLFERLVQKTGGSETRWARAVAAARKGDQDPLRIQYREEMAQIEAARGREIQAYLLANSAVSARERDREVVRIASRYPSRSFMSRTAAERAHLEREFARSEKWMRERTNVAQPGLAPRDDDRIVGRRR